MYKEQTISELSTLFQLPATTTAGSFKQQLTYTINHLINHDFFALVQLLYRLDINESKLKKILQENTDTDAGLLIADMVIERQVEKIKTRELFKNKNPIDDEEKW